jgi:hypothetical protein
MKTRIRIIFISLICLAFMGERVNAQDSGWSPPIFLSSEKASAWFPDVAADEYGRVHVVWSQATGSFDNVIYTYSDDGQSWLPGTDIIAIPADRGSEATRPNLTISEDPSKLFLLYRYNQVYIAEAQNVDTAKASNWTTSSILSDMNQVAYFSDAEFDHDGNLHSLVTWNVPTIDCEICYHVFYRKLAKDSGRWTTANDISILDVGTAKPDLLIDEQQIVHAVWETSNEGGGSYGAVSKPVYISYARSLDGGASWLEPIKFNSVQEESRNPAIAQDRNEQILVVWSGLPEDQIYYRISSSGGEDWSASSIIPGISGGWSVYNTMLDSSNMAVDSDGIVHLVLVGRLAGLEDRLQVIHLSWDGDRWSEPDVIATYQGDVPEWPRIAVSEGNKLNVVWFLRDAENVWDTVNGNYRILFSQLVTSAIAKTPKVRPTRTPTPEGTEIIRTVPPEVTQSFNLETATITPTETANWAPPTGYVPGENAYYKEMDYLKLVVVAVIPAILFVGLMLIIILLRRKKNMR